MSSEAPRSSGPKPIDGAAVTTASGMAGAGRHWPIAAGIVMCAVLFGASWAAARSMARLDAGAAVHAARVAPGARVGADLAPTHGEPAAPGRRAAAGSAFSVWDLTISPGAPLAAWQVEVAPAASAGAMADGPSALGPASGGTGLDGPALGGDAGLADRPQPHAAGIVGIEGGEGAFAEPAHYDPAALGGNRLVLGAFSLEPADQLPTQPFRAATIHVHAPPGVTTAPLRVRLEAAAGPDGKPVRATATLVPRSR